MGKFVVPPKRTPIARIVPKAKDVKVVDRTGSVAISSSVPLPDSMCQRMGNPTMVIAFDIETHDWSKNGYGRGRIGQFGWYTARDEEDLTLARIVQLAWCVGNATIPEISKSYFVRPFGFTLAAKASIFHGIGQEKTQEGRPLQDVLQEFMTDVRRCTQQGGQVVAHHLEFDAGVVHNELKRCGLDAFADEWTAIARKGFCTMSPVIGCWLKQACCEEVSHAHGKHNLGLVPMCRRLAPEALENHHPRQNVVRPTFNGQHLLTHTFYRPGLHVNVISRRFCKVRAICNGIGLAMYTQLVVSMSASINEDIAARIEVNTFKTQRLHCAVNPYTFHEGCDSRTKA